MDSRSYIFIYAVKTSADIPTDFSAQVQNFSFDKGVFLPQDDSNWFTRSPKYPARLLLLKARSLFIVPHPTSQHAAVEIKLDDLLQLETGTALLLGWMRFTTKAGVQELIYNTRASRPLENFLGILKQRWLEKFPPKPNGQTHSYGDELDIKFKNSMNFELMEGERVLARCFEAPLEFQKQFLFFKREHCHPGNLILWTSANRLVWITDGLRGRRELYASISFSVPCETLRSWRVDQVESKRFLEISFDSGLRWRMLIHDNPESFYNELGQVAESNGAHASREDPSLI